MGQSVRRRGEVVGVLDIGTAKTACLVVAPGPRPAGMRVLGIGHQPSRGMKAGVAVELDAVEQAVRAAVNEAERAAGVRLEEVFLAVACGRLKSVSFAANAKIEGRVVTDRDMQRLATAGRSFAEREGRTLLHMECLSYRLDAARGIANPRGLHGAALGADVVAVTADETPVRNLLYVVERADLSAAGLVPAPYSSSLAATTREERQAGVVSIDMGAGTTGIAVFAQGHLLASDVVPVGGNHITFDIARTLSAPLFEAERIKQDYGTLGGSACDPHEVISYALAGEDTPALYQTTRGQVRDIVEARTVALFGQLAERIERSGVASYAGQLMVLTGGASRLRGLGDAAAQFFGRPVRVATIAALPGMPQSMSSPAFATAVGLAHLALDPAAVVRRGGDGLQEGSYLQRMGDWLRESF